MSNVYIYQTPVSDCIEFALDVDVYAYLTKKWSKFPDTAKIYLGTISDATDVTPKNEEQVEFILHTQGDYYIVLDAGDPAVVGYIYFALAVVIALTNKPDIPVIRNVQASSANNELSERSNRIRLNGRIPDPFGTNIMVPDLIGVPYFVYDNHVKVEYTELCFGRGEYEFLLAREGVYDIRDGDTLLAEIEGAGIEIYGPFKSVNNSTPDIQFGAANTSPMLAAKKCDAVNGQTLLAPNESDEYTNQQVAFAKTDLLVSKVGGTIDFTEFITTTVSVLAPPYAAATLISVDGAPISWSISGAVYDSGTITYSSTNALASVPAYGAVYLEWTMLISASPVSITGNFMLLSNVDNLDGTHTLTLHAPAFVVPALASHTGTSEAFVLGGNSIEVIVDYSGTYDVLTVTTNELELDDPISVNPAWYWQYYLGTDYATSEAAFYFSTASVIVGAALISDNWIGPFTINLTGMDGYISNFVAVQGLYKDDGTTQTSTSVDIALELVPVNAAGDSLDDPIVVTGTVVGTATSRTERALTLQNSVALTVNSRYRVRARRITPKDVSFSGQISDEIKWADLYGTQEISQSHFGNVTTARAITTATTGALAVKSRRLSARGVRKVKAIEPGGTLAASTSASNRACDILAHVCIDDRIGNRSVGDVDLVALLEAYTAIVDNFGSAKAAEFCYTFDKANMSFEETASSIADAVFCVAYREGSVISMRAELPNAQPRLLFNHRNKIPKSETRTVTFGTDGDTDGDIDGIELEYRSPEDGATLTYYIPTDQTAINPRKVAPVGVANPLQAYFHAWRSWNKILYQRYLAEFSATEEAEILLRNDSILLATELRPNIQDGEIYSKSGLRLTLSQPVTFADGVSYTIFIQCIDGTIESRGIASTADEYQVDIASDIVGTLSLDGSNYARATYLIVGNTDSWPKQFMVRERETADNLISKIVAVNYDPRYYGNDTDFIDEIVDENGAYIV